MADIDVRVCRVYDEGSEQDGARVLVDRIWPRGLAREKAAGWEWCKEIAPSSELRRWYGHDPARFTEFARRYRCELEQPERSAALAQLRRLASRQRVTLLTATRQPEFSQAAVLAEHLRTGGEQE